MYALVHCVQYLLKRSQTELKSVIRTRSFKSPTDSAAHQNIKAKHLLLVVEIFRQLYVIM